MNINLLIVEDEVIINDYIYSIFENSKMNIKRAYSGAEAIKIIKDNKIHLIISDIIMEDKDGFDVLHYIATNNYKIPVIMLTALLDDKSLYKAYDLGAVDYITKPVNKTLLEVKVNNLIKHLYNEATNEFELLKESNSIIISGEHIELTKTEFDILELLYINSPRIYTKDNLIDNIWHSNYDMSSKIIEVNIFNIRKKMGPLSIFLKTKRGIGYYFENKK